MSVSCPIRIDVESLHREVRAEYERVAAEPEGDFHFHRGVDFAVELLRYERGELESLPREATSRFAGVANPHRIGTLRPGETVLDIGSGAGTDLLLAARRVGPGGRAIGVDMTGAMREIATESARRAGMDRFVEVVEGTAEELPVADESVDVVISNGVLNLVPDKERAFAEIYRVLRPGGRLHLGDTQIARLLSVDARNNIELWAA